MLQHSTGHTTGLLAIGRIQALSNQWAETIEAHPNLVERLGLVRTMCT